MNDGFSHCRVGSEANNHAVWGRISVLFVTLRNAIYSGARRNAPCVNDHEVEMYGVGQLGCREEEINQVTSAATPLRRV